MTEEQNALLVFEEELGELAMELLKLQQKVSKAIRFGLNSRGEVSIDNKSDIEAEWNDLLGSIKHLQEVGVDLSLNTELVEKKVDKIKKYTQVSKELGRLSE